MQFQHTAARRRLLKIGKLSCVANNVSTHSRPKAAATISFASKYLHAVSTHSRPKAAADCDCDGRRETMVSTHSRPKAAAPVTRQIIKLPVVSTHSRPKAAATCHACCTCYCCRFNTQPPEGGCNRVVLILGVKCSFNTQPPEGGCGSALVNWLQVNKFQHTAARRRLRLQFLPKFLPLVVSTHSRPKAAANQTIKFTETLNVSTHSRPKAAAKIQKLVLTTSKCFNTQPPEGGCL